MKYHRPVRYLFCDLGALYWSVIVKLTSLIMLRVGDTLRVEITKDNLPLGCNVRHIDGRSETWELKNNHYLLDLDTGGKVNHI